MKHLVLFSLFTVSFASYSMDHKALIITDKNVTIMRKAFKNADEKFERQCDLIVKNKPCQDKKFLNPAIKPNPYIDCALIRLPSDVGNDNAHDVADLYVQEVYWYAHMRNKKLTEDDQIRLIMRARTIRQFQVTYQEKKEAEEMVEKKIKEDGLWIDLLLWRQNEAPEKRDRIR